MMRKWKRRIRRFLKFLILGDSQRKKRPNACVPFEPVTYHIDTVFPDKETKERSMKRIREMENEMAVKSA
jgi:hypothetical protein